MSSKPNFIFYKEIEDIIRNDFSEVNNAFDIYSLLTTNK